MNHQKNNHDLPPHPFFEIAIDQPNFTDCINAIDRARSVIALCDVLKLEEEEGGLSPEAAFGFYWMTVLSRSALSYVSRRLVTLNQENEEQLRQASVYLSALLHSLPTLDGESLERLLDQTAVQLDLARPEVDRFIERITATR